MCLFVPGVILSPAVRSAHASGPLISYETRLMVFSPHPDDETLGVGGLIQRVLSAGGKVEVVFMTDGEGYAGGVEKEDHTSHPTVKDYRDYGALRRSEALKAAATLGLRSQDVSFLGFPDDGLYYLRTTFFRSRLSFLSPATMENRPPKSERIIPDATYTGRELLKEMERLLARFRPTLLATTPALDWHPDHNSTYFFVKKALVYWQSKNPKPGPELITFLIHFGKWPPPQGSGADSPLEPPPYSPGNIRWLSFPLTPREVEIKRKAILEYRSQMLVMGSYLMSFARGNELYMLDKGRRQKSRAGRAQK